MNQAIKMRQVPPEDSGIEALIFENFVMRSLSIFSPSQSRYCLALTRAKNRSHKDIRNLLHRKSANKKYFDAVLKHKEEIKCGF